MNREEKRKADSDLGVMITDLVGKIANGTVSIIKQDSVVIQINTSEVIRTVKVKQAVRIGGRYDG